MEKVYIFGHRNPDTDSVTAAITLSYLKNKLGMNTIPAVLSSINLESKFALNYFNVPEPIFLNDINIKNLDIKTDEMEDLWKSFYNTIGIKGRKNDRCRMNFMPKKYWKYILEVENEETGK